MNHSKIQQKCFRAALLIACLMGGGIVIPAPGFAQQEQSNDTREKILADQEKLARDYELLEKKLFSLYQLESERNPERAQLLKQAYQQSQEQLTLQQLGSVIQMLQQSRLRDAEKNQQVTSEQLQSLLALLESEDRGKRVREEIERYKLYLKEVNRLLRIQQGLRGQAENDPANPRVITAQKQNADRTEKLGNEVEKNEEGGKGQGEPMDGEQVESGENKPGESEPAEGVPGEGEPGEGGSGEQGEGKPGEQAEDQQPKNPVQQRLEQAAKKMRDAQQKLEDAKQSDSIEDMNQAERELAKAKEELEQILRQLRDEEIKRTLTTLEARFRHMLQVQIKIHEDTIRLNDSRDGETTITAEVDRECGRLSNGERKLNDEVAKALLLLEDDGSSVAIAETLRQTNADIQQVADRLAATKSAETTQEIQAGIIETLGFLVEVFEDAREDQDDAQAEQNQKGQSGQPGEQKLLNQLAELKLIRGLQQQILTRHSRYAAMLQDPNHPVGHSDDPGIRHALDRLGQRQQTLHQITEDIVSGENQ